MAQRAQRVQQNQAKAVSFDEMWTYVGARKEPKRNSVWIWTAVIEWEDGSREMRFEVGKRDEETFLRLLDQVPLSESYHTDCYEVYSWLPRTQHRRGKYGLTNRNEGVHSVLRGRLARLIRRTKAYTKSVAMLRDSLALVSLYLGWT